MGHFPERISRLPPFTGPFSAHMLDAEGCQVLFASYPAEQRIPVHHHETENVGMVSQGEMLLTLGGVERSFRPGQWYHIPAGAAHAARFCTATSIIEFRFDQGILTP
ncbi:MAG: cupin domain-containing protein [bacterium]